MKSLFLVLLVAVAFACGGRAKRRTLVPDVPQTGDATARKRFADAKAKFLRDGKNREDFDRIAEDFPEDPIVPWAKLYAGIGAVGDRKYDVAVKALDEVLAHDVPDALAKRAHLFMGIAKNYLGDAKLAFSHLQKGKESCCENDPERLEYLGAQAYATSVVEPLASLKLFDQLYGKVTPTERVLIVQRCEEVAGTIDPRELRKAVDDLDKKGPAMAAVASRLAILADQAGAADDSKHFREVAGPARHAVGLPKTIRASAIAVSGTGNPGLVGAIMPTKNKAGDAAQAGLGLAAGAADKVGVAAIEIRTAGDESAAALAVERLAKQNVVAIIGPIDGASVDTAGTRAESLGVPLLSLASRPEERTTGRFVFHMRHSAEARGRALAKKALAAGIKTFAIMSPDDKYGTSVTAAFSDEVKKGGGSIVSKVIYPDATKSFVSFAGKLTGSFEALFVPDTDVKLSLIAPAVSATGRIPKPIGTKLRGGKTAIVLLSTAEGITGNFLANADRHADGAILAPGYYPDDKDAVQKAFLDRFLAAFGRAPGPNEAYAYDAAMIAASAGTNGRAALAATLAAGKADGITGLIQFDKNHLRADPGVLYTVVDESGVYAIRRIP